jgi:hypothetical protein
VPCERLPRFVAFGHDAPVDLFDADSVGREVGLLAGAPNGITEACCSCSQTVISRGVGSCGIPLMTNMSPLLTMVARTVVSAFQRSRPPWASRTSASNAFMPVSCSVVPDAGGRSGVDPAARLAGRGVR